MPFRRIFNLAKGPDFSRVPLTATALGDIVAVVMADRLGPEFLRMSNLCWVANPENSVRRMLKYEALKGATYSGIWGVSIDFVPLLGNGRFRSKKTAKSAYFDLTIDPIDISGDVPSWCSFSLYDDAERVKTAAMDVLDAAKADWAKLVSLQDVADTFEIRSRMKFRRFSLHSYVQTDLAWGLAQIAIGERDAGERRLEAFCEAFGVDFHCRAITKAREVATAIAVSG